MRKSRLLLIDAFINLLVGLLLVTFHPEIVKILGVPTAQNAFYPNILGAVLFGIGIALLIEYFKESRGFSGLGLSGAIAINLCGGLVLGGWLFFGNLNIPSRGHIFLWVLVGILIVISGVELFVLLIKAGIKSRD